MCFCKFKFISLSFSISFTSSSWVFDLLPLSSLSLFGLPIVLSRFPEVSNASVLQITSSDWRMRPIPQALQSSESLFAKLWQSPDQNDDDCYHDKAKIWLYLLIKIGLRELAIYNNNYQNIILNLDLTLPLFVCNKDLSGYQCFH